MFNFKFDFDFVPVSSDFIENYMKGVNGEYIKVYLYMLDMAVKGKEADPRLIAKKLGILENDVMNAVEHWQEQGVIVSEDMTFKIGVSMQDTAAETAAEADNEDAGFAGSKIPAVPDEAPNPAYTKKTAAEAAMNPLVNEKLAEIAAMAQEFLERTLNDSEIGTLYWFYDKLGFPAELIMMVLEYCVSKGKRDMRYIEKVAISWHENGINDIVSAEKYMADEAQRRKYHYELKKLFGITDRNFSKTEEALINQWHDGYGMGLEMIALAYEYCIMAIGKLGFRYMDKIIRNWHKAGINTIEEAERDHEEFKKRTAKFTDKDASVYKPDGTNYSEIERRMNAKY